MKKIFAIMLALVLAVSASCTALATGQTDGEELGKSIVNELTNAFETGSANTLYVGLDSGEQFYSVALQKGEDSIVIELVLNGESAPIDIVFDSECVKLQQGSQTFGIQYSELLELAINVAEKLAGQLNGLSIDWDKLSDVLDLASDGLGLALGDAVTLFTNISTVITSESGVDEESGWNRFVYSVKFGDLVTALLNTVDTMVADEAHQTFIAEVIALYAGEGTDTESIAAALPALWSMYRATLESSLSDAADYTLSFEMSISPDMDGLGYSISLADAQGVAMIYFETVVLYENENTITEYGLVSVAGELIASFEETVVTDEEGHLVSVTGNVSFAGQTVSMSLVDDSLTYSLNDEVLFAANWGMTDENTFALGMKTLESICPYTINVVLSKLVPAEGIVAGGELTVLAEDASLLDIMVLATATDPYVMDDANIQWLTAADLANLWGLN